MKKIILAVTLGLVVGFVWPALGSRNSSGTFTVLNNGTTVVNPVSAGQVITKDLWNGTFADVGTEITDSLSRSGKGGMLAPLVLVDSSGTTLDLTWPALTLTGFYATSGPLVGIQTGGVTRQTWGPTGVIFPGDVNAATFQTPVLYVEDPGVGTNKVTIQAPSGLAASYSVTLPPSHPASTLPVTWTSTGVLAQQQITNSMQNFGTPSADTDVVIKSYLEPPTATAKSWTSLTVTGTGCTASGWAYTKVNGIVYMRGSLTGNGSAASCSASANLSANYRPGATLTFDSPQAGLCTISTAGAVSCSSMTSNNAYFDGITFPAEN